MSMIGTKGRFTRVIAATDTAAAVGSGTVDVCATPVIAAAMEAAAVAALAPYHGGHAHFFIAHCSELNRDDADRRRGNHGAHRTAVRIYCDGA